jgi:hypothetical protein
MPFEAEKIKTYTPNKEALDMILNHIKITMRKGNIYTRRD